jgi:hypothetical protein
MPNRPFLEDSKRTSLGVQRPGSPTHPSRQVTGDGRADAQMATHTSEVPSRGAPVVVDADGARAPR